MVGNPEEKARAQHAPQLLRAGRVYGKGLLVLLRKQPARKRRLQRKKSGAVRRC